MKITKSQFISAWTSYMDEAGCSYDPFDREMSWRQFKSNKGSQEIMMPLIEPYLSPVSEEESVVVKKS